MMGMGEKNPEMQQNEPKRKSRKNSPLFALPSPPRLRNGGRLFSGVQKHRKQAGPTLSGRGILD